MPYSVPLIPTFPLVLLPSFLLSLILSEFALLKVLVFSTSPESFKCLGEGNNGSNLQFAHPNTPAANPLATFLRYTAVPES